MLRDIPFQSRLHPECLDIEEVCISSIRAPHGQISFHGLNYKYPEKNHTSVSIYTD